MSQAEPHLIGGRYELGELLGRGGMAEVRKGYDTRLGRAVAIKRLRTDLASDATFQARFRREAQSAASLNHPMVVAVYDTGEEWNDGGNPDQVGVAQPYIVMEYVAGRTLREILREGRKILPERALEITADVLTALDYSHRAGIIHRDIKPGNVMLTPSGDVKVMDFGIARAVSDASASMTQTAAVVGTAQYLSPEQARGETVDSRSDVYSAGCLLYELLTGRPPFMGESPVAVAYQHVREPAQPPSDFDTEIDADIDAIVLKALTKRVDERYQSAAAMKADVERYLAGRPIQAAVVPTHATTVFAADDETDRTMVAPVAPPPVAPAKTPRPPEKDDDRGGAGAWILVGLLLAALIVAAAVFLPKLFEPESKQVPVPNLINLTEQQARTKIIENDLSVGKVDYEADESVPKDQVISQSPDRDNYVDPGTEVNIVVSKGQPMVSVPAVVGKQREEARALLESQQLRVRFQPQDSDEPRGQVLASNPPEGQQVAEDSIVTLTISSGPSGVPDVVGKSEAEAKSILEAAGFTNIFVTKSSDTTEPEGTVIEQSPTGKQPKTQQITLVVSSYVEPTETPTPTVTPTETPTVTPTETVPTETPTQGNGNGNGNGKGNGGG